MPRPARTKDLRRTIDRLPLRTREAMLRGLDEERIIVGAYADRHGGVCPMLAAHRRGGRTDFLRFAQTWDRFAHAPSRGSRTATRRELRTLRRLLEQSVAAATDAPDMRLGDAIAAHRALVARRAPRVAGRAPTLRLPAWMRPVRDVEELAALLTAAEREALQRTLSDPGTPGPASPKDAGRALARH